MKDIKTVKEYYLFLAKLGMYLSPNPEICVATWLETGEKYTLKDLEKIFPL